MAGQDACLFYGTFEGALKGLVIHVMAMHDTAPWIGRMRKSANPEPRPECPARGYFRSRASGSATLLRPSVRPSATMPVHATAARAGWVPSFPGNIKARSWGALPPAR